MNTRVVNLSNELSPHAGMPHGAVAVTTAAILSTGYLTAVSKTEVPDGVRAVRIQVTGGTVAMTVDGTTTPAAGTGFVLVENGERLMSRAEFLAAKVINLSGTTKVQVQGFTH